MVARRYAQALMNLSAKEDQVDGVGGALDEFCATLVDAPQLAAFLVEPKVPQSAKEEAVAELLKKMEAPALVSTFLRFMTSKRRISLAPDVTKVFHELADERQGRAHADVTVAEALTSKQEDGLRMRLEALSGKQINLRLKIDPDILGGIVARIGSKVWDASLRNQLDQVHQKLTQG